MEALAEALCARGHEVHVVLPWHPELRLERPGRSAVLHAFKYSPVSAWHPWGYAQALTADRSLRWDAYLAAPLATVAAARALRKIIDAASIEVLHANWLLPSAPIVRLALRGREQPMVVSCHGSGVFLAERHGWAASVARWALRRCSAVTACSRDLTERVGRLGAGPEPIWIPYGVDVDRFRPPGPEARNSARRELSDKFGVPDTDLWIFAVGRLVYKKGFDRLVEALPAVRREAPSARLLIAGEGPLQDDLARQADEAGVAEAVHFLGPMAHAALPGAYQAADLVAVPSVHGPGGNVDGLPNVFLEALASGTAVVASRVGGMPDIARDQETAALVPEGDAGALASAIVGLLGNEERRRAMGAAARADAESRLDWSRVAARFEELYGAVLNE